MHSHLDWHETDQWLDGEDAPVRLAWSNNKLVGLLATSTPLNHTVWLRLAAVHDDAQPGPILSALWNDIVEELRGLEIHTVALLMLRDWILHYASDLGFHYVEEIVTLRRPGLALPPEVPLPVEIRPAEDDDIKAITRVDQAAFTPPWQLTLSELRQAQRVAAMTTVAVKAGEIVGYQLSTLYFDGSHLARLAVAPTAQRMGIGSALLTDTLRRFSRRGVTSMTVNTQASNTRSQRLYADFGFVRNGYDLPVWMADI
jgi:ribosomal-protein-alanine N-acetyltransferase